MPDQSPAHEALRGRFAEVYRCLKMKIGTSRDLKWMGTWLFLSASVRIHLGFVTAQPPPPSRPSTESPTPTHGCAPRVQRGPGIRAGPSAAWLGDKVGKHAHGAYPVESSSFTIATGDAPRGHYHCKMETLEDSSYIHGLSSSATT